jgi:tetratricopeptide (TPR) repeat protein
MLNGSIARIGVALLSAVVFCRVPLFGQNESFEDRFQQATEAMRNGQLDQAAADFSKCIAAEPNFAQSYFNLGLIRFQQGRWEEAAGLFTKSVTLKPGLRGADLFLGIAEYRLDQYDGAVTALKRAATLEPANPDALMWLGIAELGSGDAASAVTNLEKASKLKPNNVDILYHLGRAYMQLSKETYEAMYQADPKSWRVHQVLAESFKEAERLDDAVKECQEAINMRPNDAALHDLLGDIYWKQNNLEKAEAEFQAELKISPQDFSAMYKLGTVSVERSRPEVAVQLLTEVLRKHPESREAHYQLGRADTQLGKTDEAIRNFSAAVNGKGPIDSELLRQSYYQLAQSYRRAQRFEESRVALNEFARLKQEADNEQEQKLQDKLRRSTEPQQ